MSGDLCTSIIQLFCSYVNVYMHIISSSPSCVCMPLQGEMDKWAKRAIEGHFAGKFPWYPIEDFVIEESARIVGGKPIEVTIMNTLTVNVHLSMVSRLS